jgi:catechol 2,3-dioxygenase-like lactoylglutathione lyase family enzyme
MLRLDHVTINTSRLDESVSFYDAFLDLRPGWRPPFTVGGAWLYPRGGDYAILHLIETVEIPGAGMFDHVAFRSIGLLPYLDSLKEAKCWYRALPVLGTRLVQIHHRDPSGVLVEVNFEDEAIPESEIVR